MPPHYVRGSDIGGISTLISEGKPSDAIKAEVSDTTAAGIRTTADDKIIQQKNIPIQ